MHLVSDIGISDTLLYVYSDKLADIAGPLPPNPRLSGRETVCEKIRVYFEINVITSERVSNKNVDGAEGFESTCFY